MKETKTAQENAAAEGASPYPKMHIGQKMHQIMTSKTKTDIELQTKVFEEIATDLENPSLYRKLQEKLNDGMGSQTDSNVIKLSAEDLSVMDEKNKKTLDELLIKVEEAKESAGDMELMDARINIARFCAKSMSEEETIDAYTQVLELPKMSSGKKIDALMELARVASFYGNTSGSDDYIDRANKLANEGGGADWDRRNRLKVYRALQRMLHRDMEVSSSLLLDCIATFSCSEICSYTEFIVYVILTNLLHLPRPELKSKIIDGPEVLSVATEIPTVVSIFESLKVKFFSYLTCLFILQQKIEMTSGQKIKLVTSFYDCDYKGYLNAMVEVENVLLNDRFLYPHASFWMRELHILAYKQFLDSYQSVTLQAMADAFGVSTTFIDYHASRFIAASRLSAKIDKYGGVIITNRPDLKNAQYREMIQKGDLLLNRIQKLARVVDL